MDPDEGLTILLTEAFREIAADTPSPEDDRRVAKFDVGFRARRVIVLAPMFEEPEVGSQPWSRTLFRVVAPGGVSTCGDTERTGGSKTPLITSGLSP